MNFCNYIDIKIIPNYNSEPIDVCVIHWNNNLKVICIINCVGFYILEYIKN